jgi:AAA lid domain
MASAMCRSVTSKQKSLAAPWLQVSAYTNGRSEVTMQDCLLLQHLMWQAPNEAERIAEWLLAQLAEGGDVRQCDYLLNSASLAGNPELGYFCTQSRTCARAQNGVMIGCYLGHRQCLLRFCQDRSCVCTP